MNVFIEVYKAWHSFPNPLEDWFSSVGTCRMVLTVLSLSLYLLLLVFFSHTVTRGRCVSHRLKIAALNGNLSSWCIPPRSSSTGVFLCVTNLQGVNSVTMWSPRMNTWLRKITEAYYLFLFYKYTFEVSFSHFLVGTHFDKKKKKRETEEDH